MKYGRTMTVSVPPAPTISRSAGRRSSSAPRDSQLRRLEDVTLAGGLHLNHGHATSRAVTRGIRYRYVGIGEQTAAAELRRLIADRDTLQTFCLNDAVQELPSDVVDRQVRAFLAERFPDMGSFEKLPG